MSVNKLKKNKPVILLGLGSSVLLLGIWHYLPQHFTLNIYATYYIISKGILFASITLLLLLVFTSIFIIRRILSAK